MAFVAFLIRSSRLVVLLSVVAGAISGAAGVALIAVIHRAMSEAEPAGPALGWTFAALCLVAVGSRVVAQAAMIRLGQGAVTKLVVLLCRKILALPLAQFERSDPAGLLATLTEDVVIVAGALMGIPLLCINLPVVAACLAYAGWLSPAILAWGTGFAALAIAANVGIASRGVARLRFARAGQDVLVAHFRALVDGFRELKQHRERRDAFLAQELEPAAAAVRDRTAQGLTYFAVAEGWSVLGFFGFIGLLLFLLPGLGLVDRQAMAGGVLIVLYIMTPLDVIVTWLPILGRARASIQKIEALIPSLDERAEQDDHSRVPLAFHETIKLEGVSYAYGTEPSESGFALGPIDLTLRAGELVFVAGGNGSGKTTLVKLLCGLYRPELGAILVDDRPVDEVRQEPYRHLFSVVFADGYLFQTLLGLEGDELEERAERGLERLGLSGRVRVEGNRYSTISLSLGQRRRLGLLTACLEDRPIVVFDEWAANQDPALKRSFYFELLPELKAAGKTLVVVSHDEEYYRVADRVIRLRDGRIGSDGELLDALAASDGHRLGEALS